MMLPFGGYQRERWGGEEEFSVSTGLDTDTLATRGMTTVTFQMAFSSKI